MKRLVLMVASGLLVVGIFAPSAFAVAGAVRPDETGGGNPPCAGTKIDPLVSGVYDIRGGYIDIHVVSTSKGPAFWFISNAVIDVLTVKGGPAYAVYFEPEDGESYLYHSIVNPKNPNGYWYGLSHLCVESHKKTAPPKS
jgi:hypothetical protein